jgi:uncharacterized membrane protein YgcG
VVAVDTAAVVLVVVAVHLAASAALVVAVFPVEVLLETGSNCWQTKILNQTDITAIENKIAQIESVKKNQIVVGILKASDTYPVARWRTSLILFFLFSFILGAIFVDISHLSFLLQYLPR